jgi:hypothetical protein
MVVTVTISFILISTCRSSISKKLNNEGEDTSSNIRNVSTLLIWTTFFKQNGIKGYFNSDSSTIRLDCPESLCEVTSERERLSIADGVVFHAIDMSRLGLYRQFIHI